MLQIKIIQQHSLFPKQVGVGFKNKNNEHKYYLDLLYNFTHFAIIRTSESMDAKGVKR